ncbi:hypothetical protein, partial [Streptomyces sp. CC208A]|uniref:hypothetical protein n=1 Tax=Streptomyces sp. CC208A TaxID=3044573 RepID=UPI0024A99495
MPLVNGRASTDNTRFKMAEADSGDYKSTAAYSGDATHHPITSQCGAEHTNITITDNRSPQISGRMTTAPPQRCGGAVAVGGP